MKIIILSECAELIRETVEKEGHAVVACTNSAARLLWLIVERTPHFVFTEKRDDIEIVIANLEMLFSTVRFVRLGFERGTTWPTAIRKALRQQRINLPWKATEPQKSQTLIDPRYYSISTSSKGSLSTITDADATIIETSRLYWMLRIARKTGPPAEVYREATGKLMGFAWRDIVYHTVSDSFQSPALARDILARALGYLSHYVPGVDLDGLPRPVDEPPDLRYLHYYSPPELRYALFSLSLFGFNASLLKHLQHAIQWRSIPQTAEDLAEASQKMIGLAFTAHRLGWAQSIAIKWLLDSESISISEMPEQNETRRALETFAHWWGFQRIIGDSDRLTSVLQQLHANEIDQRLPEELQLPSFSEFLKACEA